MSGIVGDGSVYTCKHLMRVKRPEDCVFCHRDQLRGTLSLAEEGLANYAQEVKGAQHDIEQLMAAASAEANEVERLRALLREVYNHGENGDLHKKIGAVFGVEPGEDIPAVPQSAEHELTTPKMIDRS